MILERILGKSITINEVYVQLELDKPKSGAHLYDLVCESIDSDSEKRRLSRATLYARLVKLDHRGHLYTSPARRENGKRCLVFQLTWDGVQAAKQYGLDTFDKVQV